MSLVRPQTTVTSSADGTDAAGADIGIVVVGGPPYAEGTGDNLDLQLAAGELAAVANLKAAGILVVTVLLSGRQVMINDILDPSDAFIAAWLPGTERQGGGGCAVRRLPPNRKTLLHLAAFHRRASYQQRR